MHRVHYDSDYITLLSDSEILEPFKVLEQAFRRYRSPERASDQLYEILIASSRGAHWKKYASPLILYKKYKQVVRLIEAAWLIDKNKENYGFVPQEFRTEIPLKESDTNDISAQSRFSRAILIIAKIFRRHSMCYLKGAIYDFLFLAMEPTYTDHLDQEYQDISIFESLNQLILALFEFYEFYPRKESSTFDRSKWKEHLEQHRTRETLYDYIYSLEDFFYLTSKEDLLSGIRSATKILCSEGYWKSHENPADIIYLFYEYLFMIEQFWRIWLGALDANIDLSSPWRFSKKILKTLKSADQMKLIYAWDFLKKRFARRDILYWCRLWDDCLQTLLINRSSPARKNGRYHRILEFIEGLVHLSEFESFMSWEYPYLDEDKVPMESRLETRTHPNN
ncbi:hypothetical protein [Sphingobacterium hotanense]|uniref:hypothetical protein n=1 Tax=Sphingobacterium hotanense TaxID=649196 RepID=UPI0021A3D5B2|nr:hypothetical protein [Sphingobacterium hotanense]MCT1525693.1 hypothetical protein [Sphingobacterium hotanense]